MRIISFFTIFLCLCLTLSATNYYVSPNGDNSRDGLTKETSWASINYATLHVAADAGNSIVILTGIYPVYETIYLPTGVNLIGESSQASDVELQCQNASLSSVIRLESGSINFSFPNGNQVLKNFSLNGFGKVLKGIVVTGRHNVKILNLHVRNFIDCGITLSAVEQFYSNNFENLKISGSELAYCKVSECSRERPGSDFLYNSNIDIGGWNGGLMHNCIVSDTLGLDSESGQALRAVGMSKVKIYNNDFKVDSYTENHWGGIFAVLTGYTAGLEFFNNTLNSGISCEHHTPLQGEIIPGVKNIMIYNNRFVSSKPDGVGMQAIELYPPNCEIYNNLFFNFYQGITSWGPANKDHEGVKNINVHHNIFRGTNKGGWALGMFQADESGDDTITTVYNNYKIYNNVFERYNYVFYNTRGKMLNIAFSNNVCQNINTAVLGHDSNSPAENAIFDTNLFNNCAKLQSDNSAEIKNSFTNIDPGFNLSGDYLLNYYKPINGQSGVVDKGISIDGFTNGFAGAAPDLGAFELNGTTPKILLAPVFSLLSGKYFGEQQLEITSFSPGFQIIYTLDGSEPTTENSLVYTNPISIDKSLTIKAKASQEFMFDSYTQTAEYFILSNQAVKPVAFPVENSMEGPQIVKLSTPSSNAKIYYTLDNSIPNEINSLLYSVPIYIKKNTTIKAIALSEDAAKSEMLVANYNILPVSLSPDTIINNDDSHIVYSSDYWGIKTDVGSYKNDYSECYAGNGYFEYTFQGTGIAYLANSKSDGSDQIEIYIDNVLQTIVSQKKNATVIPLDTIFIKLDLAQGTHTFRAVKKSIIGPIRLDALLIYGSLNTNVFEIKNCGLQLNIYPNPTNSFVNIKLKNPKYSEFDFEVFNISGERCLTKKIALSEGNNEISLNLTNFKNGIYLINVRGENGLSSSRTFVIHIF